MLLNRGKPMASHKNVLKFTEFFLILFVWMVLIAAPILFFEGENYFEWSRVWKPMETIVPLFFIFLVNRFLLVPRLLFKKRRLLYVVSIAAMISVLTIGSYFYHVNFVQGQSPLRREMDNRRMQESQNPPPDRHGFDRRPPPHETNKRPMPPFANLLIFSILMVGFDTGLKASFRWSEIEKEKAKLEKESVVNQLDMLRSQVSPHFFMNTLNNIHTLVDISSDKAKEALVKLSKMMRYLLYDTAHGSTTLKKEIEFIESYINLMKLRVSDKVDIVLNLPPNIPDKTIPPLLFTSYIENAFKHGISYQHKSFINIDLVLDNERLLFVIKNSNTTKSLQNKKSGIGIENARKRLDLLYADNYHLDIIDNNDMFTINLSIPL
jgi:hypothetical protein